MPHYQVMRHCWQIYGLMDPFFRVKYIIIPNPKSNYSMFLYIILYIYTHHWQKWFGFQVSSLCDQKIVYQFTQYVPCNFRHATSPCEHGDLRFLHPFFVLSPYSQLSPYFTHFPEKNINLHKTSLKSTFKRVWCQFMAHSQDFRHCSTSSNPKM